MDQIFHNIPLVPPRFVLTTGQVQRENRKGRDEKIDDIETYEKRGDSQESADKRNKNQKELEKRKKEGRK